ncbi:MAG: hypothetical protein KatS3mg060_2355 [Dehalococcoidia bacterium]|nr:MAG: hypothetical protein KatS3mg060_2355 [Dehalococcoidia bacterium]
MPLEPEVLLHASLVAPELRIAVQRGGTRILDDTLVPMDVMAGVAGTV